MAAFYELCLGVTPVGETRGDAWVEFGLHAIPAHIAAGIEMAGPR